jgi:DNA-binding FadR family transcriptional regulator
MHSFKGLRDMAHWGLAETTPTPTRTRELYAVRQFLEGSVARSAAQYASAGEIAALEHFMTAFARALHAPAILARINRDFHLAIRKAAHNTSLLRALEEFDATLAFLPGTTFDAPGRGDQALEEHIRILKAIKLRDPDAAEHAARHHIQQAQEARLSLLFSYG